jgi:hypothetical protein
LTALAIPSAAWAYNRIRGVRTGWDLSVANSFDSVGLDDAAAGFGDTYTLGITKALRELGIPQTVDGKSTAYSAGSYAAVTVGFVEGAAIGAAALGRGTARFGGVQRVLRAALGVSEEGHAAVWAAGTLEERLFYEIGQNTVDDFTYAALKGLSPIERGRELVNLLGMERALFATSWAGLAGNLGSGLTPLGAWFVGALSGSAVAGGARAYYLWDDE